MADRIGAMLRRTSPAARRGVIVGGLAVALLTLMLPVRADNPEWGPSPFVFMTVTPDDALSDGQMVSVQAGPFPLHGTATVRQCTAGPQGPLCDPAVLASVGTGSSGNIGPLTVAVKRVISTGSTTVNCGITPCSLVAFPDRGDEWTQHHISFAGAGTIVDPTTTSPTSPSTSTAPPTSTVTTTPTPTTSTTSVLSPLSGLLCDLLRVLSDLLGGLLDGLLTFLNCPPG